MAVAAEISRTSGPLPVRDTQLGDATQWDADQSRLRGKRTRARPTISIGCKEIEHENKIKLLVQVVAMMKSQIDDACGSTVKVVC